MITNCLVAAVVVVVPGEESLVVVSSVQEEAFDVPVSVSWVRDVTISASEAGVVSIPASEVGVAPISASEGVVSISDSEVGEGTSLEVLSAEAVVDSVVNGTSSLLGLVGSVLDVEFMAVVVNVSVFVRMGALL